MTNPTFLLLLINFTALLSIQIVIILTIRRFVLSHLGSEFTYNIWLLLPVWFLGSLSYALASQANFPIEIELFAAPFSLADNIQLASNQTSESMAGYELFGGFLLLWLAGILFLCAIHIFRYFTFSNYVSTLDSVKNSHQLVEQVYKTGFSRNVRIVECKNLSSPALFGILNMIILIPSGFDSEYSHKEIRAMLYHEFVHYKRRDNVINLIALATRTLFWVNPLVHLAYHAFRTDQELSCDAIVLNELADISCVDYGNALLKSAANKGGFPEGAGLSTWISSSKLRRRTVMLEKHNAGDGLLRQKVTWYTVFFFVGLVFSLSISPSSIAQQNRATEAERVSAEANRLMNENLHQQAYEYIAEFETELQGEPRYALTLGIAAMEAGELEKSIATLELLASRADVPVYRHRARLELARAFYVMNDFDLAENMLRQVLDSNPPQAVRENINQFLDLISSSR